MLDIEKRSVLVIGGGISGITTTLEAAEAGAKVYLVEKSNYLGGRVSTLNNYFPKLCPPHCGLEINFRRIKQNENITVYTGAEVSSVDGTDGNYNIAVKLAPQMVNDKCTICGDCVGVCPEKRTDDFNYGMSKNNAIYLSHPMVYPSRYSIDPKACKGEACGECVKACKYSAIDLKAESKTINIKANAVVLATGWKPYDANKLTNLGFGKFPNVISNMMMERLASNQGPTQGKLMRPSDGKEIKSIAFVQCAGSRDENHLPYCSAVCCMGSLKQTTYVSSALPNAEINLFYIDIRASGRYEDFYEKIKSSGKVNFIKGKVAEITEDKTTKNLIVVAEDIEGGSKIRKEVDMVVLATGLVPEAKDCKLPIKLATDEYGFISGDGQEKGVFSAGTAKKPAAVSASVRDATGAALRALIS